MLWILALACVSSPSRVLLVGMDGLDRTQIETMIASGDLPNFSRLIAEGAVADLATTHPMVSPIIWTTIASGYPGDVHGVSGWTRGQGGSFSTEDVRVQRVWDIAHQHNVPTLVLGWLMSWPAPEITGALVSDRLIWSLPMNKDPTHPSVSISRDAHAQRTGLTSPPTLTQRAEQWIPDDTWLRRHRLAYQVEQYPAPFHPLKRDEVQVRAFESLWPTTDARLGLIYLSGADQISHLYWPFVNRDATAAMRRDPTVRLQAAQADRASHPGRRAYPWTEAPITPEQIASGARWVPDYYRTLDHFLGRILAQVDPKTTTLIVCSDHGFQAARTRPTLGGGHRDPGVLIAWGGATRINADLPHPSVLDITPTLLSLVGLPAARDMPGAPLTAMFETRPTRPVESYVRADAPTSSTNAPGQRKMLKQLEALGYVDGHGTSLPQED